MKREYKIVYEPITLKNGVIKECYNIYYYGGLFGGLKEFYANDLSNPQADIRIYYTKHEESL